MGDGSISLLRPFNGKTGEVFRWLIGLALAALVSYYTAQGAIRERIAKAEQGQEDILRSIQDLKADIRDLRSAVLKPVGAR